MDTYNYPESRALFTRAAKVIPCGVYGHFSPVPCIPLEAYPFYAARTQDAHIWDVDGNEFIDYMCAYGPMVLGYKNKLVDEAFLAQAQQADGASMASPKMVELAEFMVDLIPAADWAFFAKNGADVTNYACMVARAATGRKKIIGINAGYHGSAAWMQGPCHPGVIEEDLAHVIRIPWNDVPALERAIDEHDGDVAAFIATPYHHPVFADSEMPAEGYWKSVETLLRRKGIVFIIDDVRTGFRLHMGGSNEYFGFKPDLIAFCKAMANGYPISALVGAEGLKKSAAKVFQTGSYWFSAAPMAAALACLQEMQRIDAPRVMLENGKKLLDGIASIARGYGHTLNITGAPSMPFLSTAGDKGLMFHQRLCGECTRRGALFSSHHNWFLSTAHTEQDIQRTWDIVDDAFRALKKQAPASEAEHEETKSSAVSAAG